MAELNTFPVSALISYFSRFSETTLERMRQIYDELQNRTYTPGKAMSDALSFWIDGTMGWWEAWQMSAVGPVPTLFVKMRPDDEVADIGEIPVAVRNKGALETTDLVRLGTPAGLQTGGSPSRLLEKEDLQVGWAQSGRPHLVVQVHRIQPPGAKTAAAKAPKLTPGLYQSLVLVDQKLLAIVHIFVAE
jgi:hypothetical protein